jgi:hypothetical protein
MDLNDNDSQNQSMFAPYCTTHGHRLLLGYESVVSVSAAKPPRINLRCHCGTLLDHNAVE